jgi:hypothetical protein
VLVIQKVGAGVKNQTVANNGALVVKDSANFFAFSTIHASSHSAGTTGN